MGGKGKGKGKSWGESSRGWSDSRSKGWSDSSKSWPGDEDTSKDWVCEKDGCGNRNFARRQECFKCKTPRPKEEREDPQVENQRKMRVALAMGYDAETAETVIQDPRFMDSVVQYERMQESQLEQQKQVQEQEQMAQLMTHALSQGYSQEQATLYATQYLEQQKELQKQAQETQQAQQTASDGTSDAEPMDEAKLKSLALAQGYTEEQAAAYAQQYLEAAAKQAAAKAAPQSAEQAEQPAGEAGAVDGASAAEPYASIPVIVSLEEGRREFRCTFKAVMYSQNDRGRSFRDIFIKGPWRRKRTEAERDGTELTKTFRRAGDEATEARAGELADVSWSKDELASAPAGAAEPEEEDDFDAEAEDSEVEEAPPRIFHGEELPVNLVGADPSWSPISSWAEGVQRGCVVPAVAHMLMANNMVRPTLIQRYALPLCSQPSLDVLAQAQTGSGKTLAFVIPIVSRLLQQPLPARPYFPGQKAQASPVAILLSPTRELATQTSRNVSMMLQGSELGVLTMYGGETMSMQIKPIEQRQMDVVCATAGRLLDAIDQGRISLSFGSVVVLDEADQMLDLAVGLEGTVMDILEGRDLPGHDERQTLLFSATMPDFQARQFHKVLRRPPMRTRLRVGHYEEDNKGGSNRHIDQVLIRVADMDERWRRLGHDLAENWGRNPGDRGRAILFTNRIALAQPLERAVSRLGVSCGQLHGKMTQQVREEVVARFRSGDIELLIASNVASRGLDFPDVRLVMQFELPKTVEIYTHRMGRTGRNGQPGRSLAYFCGQDKRIAEPLVEFLELNGQPVPRWLGEPRARTRSRSRQRRREFID